MKQHLIQKIETILDEKEDYGDIPDAHKQQLGVLFSDNNVLKACRSVVNPDFLSKLNYEQLKEINETLTVATKKIDQLVKEIDIEMFLEDGYRVNYEGLLAEFEQKELHKQYPNIDLQYLADIYQKPFKHLRPYYDDKRLIYYNQVVIRKYVLAILQMVFNEMDLVVCYTGSEGAGKSTIATQHIYLLHYLLSNAKIIDYEFKIKDMMFNSLASFHEKEDEYFGHKYRILALDEGNELHRQNWKDEEVQKFFQRLRRERFEQRIKFICIPVLGELMTNIIMSRVNFIFEVKTLNQEKSGLLEKGHCNFYIIPRGDSIYSYQHRKNLTKDHIKTELYDLLKDKSYLKGMPHGLIIQKFKFNGVSGFDKDQYIEALKKTNKSFAMKEGKKMTATQMYVIYRSNIRLKNIGIPSTDARYATLSKFFQSIRKYFQENPRILRLEEEKFNNKYNNLAQSL